MIGWPMMHVTAVSLFMLVVRSNAKGNLSHEEFVILDVAIFFFFLKNCFYYFIQFQYDVFAVKCLGLYMIMLLVQTVTHEF